MTEKEIHQINGHYDKDPRDQEMRAWGWKINRFGDWSMDASQFILTKDAEVGLDSSRPLSETLKRSLEVDGEKQKKGGQNGRQ